MKRLATKKNKRTIRHARIRSRVSGNADRPRLAVFRSNKHISAQIINDATGTTLVSAGDAAMKLKGKKTERAIAVGGEIARRAAAATIKKVVFDRGGFLYAGRIRALADAARAGGLEF